MKNVKTPLHPPRAHPVNSPNPLISKRQQRLRTVNMGCAASIMPLLLLFGATLNITLKFSLPILAVGLGLVPFCSMIYEKKGKGCIPLTIFRVLTIGMLVIVIGSAVICMCFQHTPALFRLKRLIFAVGVHDYKDIDQFGENKCLMPEKLPAVHKDYCYVTDQALHGPDGPFPRACLSFYTDAETLQQYAEKLETAEGVEHLHYESDAWEMPEYYQEQMDNWLADQYRQTFHMPERVIFQMLRYAGIRENLSNADYYAPAFSSGLSESFGSGVIINYETGLFLAWD